MPAEVKPCKCKHEYQDKAYGEGKRVHSRMKNGQWRCSVCLNVQGMPKEVGAKGDKK